MKLAYLIGTMIELPRTALRAGEIARGEDGADFFSFGTNDLTQTCLGLSRDDAAPILAGYASAGLFAYDPFVSIDQAGVGELVRIGVERGRRARPGLQIGVCGEHGGDPQVDRVLSRVRARLRVLLALSRADRPPCRGTGGNPRQIPE